MVPSGRGMLGVVVLLDLKLGRESRPIFLSLPALCFLLCRHSFFMSTFVNLLPCARSEAEKTARVHRSVLSWSLHSSVEQVFIGCSHRTLNGVCFCGQEASVVLFAVVLGIEPNFYH